MPVLPLRNAKSDRALLIAAGMVAVWVAGAAASRLVGIWAAVGTTAVMLAGLSLVTMRGRLGGNGTWHDALLWGVPAGLVMVAGTHVLHGPVTARLPWLLSDIARLYEAFDGPGRLTAAVVMPVVVVCEEIVWRGAVFGALSERLSRVSAVGLATLLYAAAHAPIGSAGLVMTCLGAGLCWTALRALTNQLATVVVAHIVWDVAVLMLVPLVA